LPRQTKYLLSFIIGGFFLKESLKLAELYAREGCWSRVQTLAEETNLFQVRTKAAHRRIYREVHKRVVVLSRKERELLLRGRNVEVRAILWLGVCRTYDFIGDFAREILQEQVLNRTMLLPREEYRRFFEAKAATREKLAGLAASSQTKIEQVLFRMLREAGWIDTKGTVQLLLLTPSLVALFRSGDPRELAFFPLSPGEIRRCLA